MAIGAIPPVQPLPPSQPAGAAAPGAARPAAAFGEAIRDSLAAVSASEQSASQIAESVATGGPAEIHDLMAATAKASLSVDLLVQVRNRAVEAYQEIMRLQV